MDSHWEKVKQNFQTQLAASAYQLWIEPLQATQSDSGELILECPNPFFLHWVHNNYLPYIAQEYRALTGRLIQIKLHLFKSERRVANHPQPIQPYLPDFRKPDEMARLLNKSFTFERFVVGASNRMAFQASRALASDDTLYSKTLFLSLTAGFGQKPPFPGSGQLYSI